MTFLDGLLIYYGILFSVVISVLMIIILLSLRSKESTKLKPQQKETSIDLHGYMLAQPSTYTSITTTIRTRQSLNKRRIRIHRYIRSK